ncbi:tRNA (5-methylaminomethyl-2-thiouridine)(34)-methyltransferase MnmD [Bergeyella sp. RCAD1439]|uniref:tRNA (5-methylaminomethyl-2-thiouridine)(34)-methyltransferase MnmD n=1 Tax=Bergeyella anatis TaxID=3113737 RepID=UPI002E18FDF6|nr:tRNA (5-methylaminomethyl-2-thiouridine)(34)-methyltransferase MnmD [Bergeyella sp. RCAD1439]
MKREVKTTNDGSKTLFINELNEGYHSGHGALQEAQHVFIKNGLKQLNHYEINILELGFGTGLNVLVSIDEYLKNEPHQKIRYFGLEKYPVQPEEIEALNYPSLFQNPEIKIHNTKIHQIPWEEEHPILPNFHLTKIKTDFHQLASIELPPIDLVYFDCFGARVQPDLWERPLLEMVSQKMRQGGLFTTYSSKGSVRRILQDLGFEVEKKQGPPGKREMLNAIKY